MKTAIRTILLSTLLSIGLGISSAILIVIGNSFVANLFASSHYTTAAASHQFIFGVVLAYSVLFAGVSFVHLFVSITEKLAVLYPLSGGITLVVTCFLRKYSGELGTLNCGSRCADTIAPRSAEETATKLIIYVLAALYVVGVAIYVAKLVRARTRSVHSQTPANS